MNIKISTYRQLRRYLRVSWIHGPPIQPVHETIDFRGQGIGQVIYPLVEHLQLSRERERGRKGGIKCQDQPACESCTNSSTFTVETLKSVFSQSKGQYAPQIAALQLHTTSKCCELVDRLFLANKCGIANGMGPFGSICTVSGSHNFKGLNGPVRAICHTQCHSK